MGLTVDYTTPVNAGVPGTVAILRERGRTVVLLCDATTGAWDPEPAPAARCLEFLERRWRSGPLPEPSAMLEDVASLSRVIRSETSQAELAPSVSLVVLDVAAATVRLFSVGVFSLLRFDGRALQTCFGPRTLADEMIERYGWSEAQARQFRSFEVAAGPWIGDGAFVPTMSEALALEPGSALLVVPYWLADRLDPCRVRRVLGSAMPAAALRDELGHDASLIVLAG
jgi:hypothetical protein